MRAALGEYEATVWMVDDAPSRMFFAGRRWRVTDTPTRLRASVWEMRETGRPMYGWRFQATDDTGEAVVFDVYASADGWHVRGAYV